MRSCSRSTAAAAVMTVVLIGAALLPDRWLGGHRKHTHPSSDESHATLNNTGARISDSVRGKTAAGMTPSFVVTHRSDDRLFELVVNTVLAPGGLIPVSQDQRSLPALRHERQDRCIGDGKERLEILVCVRQWLHEMLTAEANQEPVKPRHRMGEFHTWTSLLYSLRLSSCTVTLSPSCDELPFYGASDARSLCGDQTKNVNVTKMDRGRRIFLTEDLSLYYLGKLKENGCLKQAASTFAVVGSSSRFFPAQRTLPVFHAPRVPVSLGIRVAGCGASTPQKHWYAVLWGKTRQLAKLGVANAVRIVSRYIPVVSTCVAQCDDELGSSLNIVNASGEAFRTLVARGILVLGVQAPSQGTTVPEALSCGTFVVARGRNLGYEFAGHPLTRRFRDPRRELDGIVRSLLAQIGFDFTRPWFSQQHPPNISKLDELRPFLPERYTSVKGHAEHVRHIFGIDDDCALRDASSYVQRSLGAPLGLDWKCPANSTA